MAMKKHFMKSTVPKHVINVDKYECFNLLDFDDPREPCKDNEYNTFYTF